MPVTMVGVNREACARYKQALDDLLPAEWMEAVYTDNPNDSVDLDKPMRDHVLLQAIARVNRPYVDAEGIHKRRPPDRGIRRVLRELKKALQFDAVDANGAIEDIDLLRADLIDRSDRAERDHPDAGEMDDAALEDDRIRRGSTAASTSAPCTTRFSRAI